MALPSSGQISFDDVRTEMSQSDATSYSMYYWVQGARVQNEIDGSRTFTPINILSSGTRWENGINDAPKRLINKWNVNDQQESNDYSMSAWYNYDRNLYIGTDTTGSLFHHSDLGRFFDTNTMLPIYIGTEDSQITINISGTLAEVTKATDSQLTVAVFYGKPWNKNASYVEYDPQFASDYDTLSRQFISGTQIFYQQVPTLPMTASINESYTYDYYYTASVGEYIYVVIQSRYVPVL